MVSFQRKKQIFIITPSYGNLDKSEYGVDTPADASVIKAVVDMSSKYFPMLLSNDRTIRLGIQKSTTCFWNSMSLNEDIGVSNRRLVDSKSDNSIDALKKEEEFLFKHFDIEEFLQTSRDALSSFGGHYFKGTSIAIEPVIPEFDEDSGYQKASQDLQNISIEPLFESIQDLLAKESTKLLDTYLCGKDIEFDLSSVKTTIELFINQDIPLAKWLSPYNASTMQQIAINKANELKDQELMAVNGPPGTGKTTLLKDIIANIIVKRALKTIDANYKIFDDKGKLIDDLKGFGIVVTSNNNAAVENISIELPKIDDDIKSSLGTINEDGFRYFEDLIRKYFEEISKNTRQSTTEEEEDIDIEGAKNSEYLGLLSIPLGKSENRIRANNLLNVLKTDIDQDQIPSEEEIKQIGLNIKSLKSKIEELLCITLQLDTEYDLDWTPKHLG